MNIGEKYSVNHYPGLVLLNFLDKKEILVPEISRILSYLND